MTCFKFMDLNPFSYSCNNVSSDSISYLSFYSTWRPYFKVHLYVYVEILTVILGTKLLEGWEKIYTCANFFHLKLGLLTADVELKLFWNLHYIIAKYVDTCNIWDNSITLKNTYNFIHIFISGIMAKASRKHHRFINRWWYKI